MSLRDDVRQFALGLEGAWLDHAWDMEGDVFKTAKGKIFLICAGEERSPSATLKLPPEECAAALTLQFVRVATWPRRWVTVTVSNEQERDIALEWAARSYEIASSRR